MEFVWITESLIICMIVYVRVWVYLIYMHNMQYYINMNTIVTDDHSRVRLSEIPDKMGSNYINGNFIDVSCFALALNFL